MHLLVHGPLAIPLLRSSVKLFRGARDDVDSCRRKVAAPAKSCQNARPQGKVNYFDVPNYSSLSRSVFWCSEETRGISVLREIHPSLIRLRIVFS